MGLDILKSVLTLVADSTIVELNFTQGDTHISLVRQLDQKSAGSTPSSSTPKRTKAPATASPLKLQNAGVSNTTPSANDDDDLVVTAPMACIFHRAPSPTSPPFIEVGDACKSGTKLCILEAMKSFTVLEAECEGSVAQFYVQDGEEVTTDQPLVRIRRG